MKSRYFSSTKLIESFKPQQQVKMANNKSQVYTGVSPTLTTIKYGYSEELLLLILNAQIEDLNTFCGATVKMEATVINETSLMIYSQFYYLKIAEILLFFFNFKMGKYGEFYGSVDPTKILIALRKFIQERNNDLDKIELEKKQSEPLKTQGANIVRGIESVKELSQKAKTDYEAFRELYPKLPTDHKGVVYWRAWRLNEVRVGKCLCEFNIKNR